jgi:hypothetical protein
VAEYTVTPEKYFRLWVISPDIEALPEDYNKLGPCTGHQAVYTWKAPPVPRSEKLWDAPPDETWGARLAQGNEKDRELLRVAVEKYCQKAWEEWIGLTSN